MCIPFNSKSRGYQKLIFDVCTKTYLCVLTGITTEAVPVSSHKVFFCVHIIIIASITILAGSLFPGPCRCARPLQNWHCSIKS